MSDYAHSDDFRLDFRASGSSNPKRQHQAANSSPTSPSKAEHNPKKRRVTPRWSLDSVETDATQVSFVSSRSSVSDNDDKVSENIDQGTEDNGSDIEDDEVEAGSDDEVESDFDVDNTQPDSDEELDDEADEEVDESDDEYAGSEAGCYRIDYSSVPCDTPVSDRTVLSINRIRPIGAFPKLVSGTGVGLDTLPDELGFMIQRYMFALEPRTIYVGWDHNAATWSYNHSENQIPRASPAFPQPEDESHNKTLLAYPYLLPAPEMSNAPYLYFDYGRDTLHVEYMRCGNSDGDKDEHNNAVNKVLRFLRGDSHAPTKLRFLTIEYCMNLLRPDEILAKLAHFSALATVTLRQHDHYCKIATENGITAEDDYNFISSEVGNLDPRDYAFEVKVVDHTNEHIKG